MKVSLDCVYYVGEKPCRYKRPCDGCPEYTPMGTRVLIIKLAAIGDVIRTTSIITGLKKKYGNPHVTWITDAAAAQLLKETDGIHRLLTYDLGSILFVMSQRFDVLICLDKEPRATALACLASADEKLGFTHSPEGSLTIFNPESRYALRLGLDDPLKFHENTKSYPEIVYEACGIPYEGQDYRVALNGEDLRWAEALFREEGITPNGKRPLIGLNTGAGPVFTHKSWTRQGFAGLARSLVQETGATVLLLGGRLEVERNRYIQEASGGVAAVIGGEQTLGQFAAMLSLLDIIVTGDTMALHLAVGLSIPTVAIFGPTSHSEVDLFGRGEKVISTIDCAPCYRSGCEKDPHCMDAISIQEVLAAILRVMGNNRRT
ncbi:MAG: glycosyltransferase family 9 protein [Deltaproteobacteria bacterium]|nr:glycosyltransferase family 9 protein [Candidatus Zymogenaceae bacterium]